MQIVTTKVISKLALFSVFSFLGHSAQPSYMPPDSIFRPTGQNVKTMVVLDSIRVYTGTQDGKDAISKLKANGYACKSALSQLWRCTRHLSNWNHNAADVQKRILKEVSELPDISFGKIWNEPQQTHESQAYNEWEMSQKIAAGDYSSEYYRLRLLSGVSYLKLLPGQQGFKEEYLWDGEVLSRVVQFSLSHNDGYTRYIFEIPYQ